MAKPHIITGLDIGRSSIKILSVLKKPGEDNLEVLARVQEPSFGVRNGVVIDVDKVAELINSCQGKIEKSLNQKITRVYTNIGGSHLFCASSQGAVAVSRADRKISKEDIDRVLQAARVYSLPSNSEILEIFPKEFIIDGQDGIKEALGMEGVRLEAKTLILGVFSPYLKNSTHAVLNSGFQIDDLVPSPLASARAVLTPREKELGVLVLDIGAGTSSLAVFEEGALIHTAVFPIGSGLITNDIAICLKTDIDTAERIKLEYGTCLLSDSDKKVKTSAKKEQIKIESLANGEPVVFSKKALVDIVEARVSEIFTQTQKELKRISRAELLPSGVVLTGGGAKMPKIKELAKKELKLPVRVGKPRGFFPSQDDPSFSLVCGLVLGGVDLENEEGLGVGGEFWQRLKKLMRIFVP